MPIYSLNGNQLYTAYDISGDGLYDAYDINGDLVFATTPTILKVMTYNVGQWYIGDSTLVPANKKAEYYNLQTNIFEAHHPDVLFIQEYRDPWCRDGSPASDLLGAFFNDQEVTNNSGYIGHSICTKDLPIVNYTSHNFPSNSGSYPTYETATITVDERTINIINTHHDYRTSYQPSEISTILSAIHNMDYFILCGDFNTNIYYPTDFNDTSTSQYIANIKPFVDAGYHVGNCGTAWLKTYYGDTESTYAARDNIITSSNIYINSIYVDESKLNDNIGDKIDHIPLIAELIIR